jgi:hypothetical protein
MSNKEAATAASQAFTSIALAVFKKASAMLPSSNLPTPAVRRALTRKGDGSASGPLAHALDLLAEGA